MREKIMNYLNDTLVSEDSNNILKTIVLIFFSNIFLNLLGVFLTSTFLRKEGIELPTSQTNIYLAFSFSVILLAVFQLVGWLISIGICFKIFLLIVGHLINMRFKNFLNFWGQLYPIKVLFIIAISVLLLSLYDYSGVTGEAFFVSWKIASDRISNLAWFLYILLGTILITNHFKTNKLRTIVALFTPYMLWVGLSAVLKYIIG